MGWDKKSIRDLFLSSVLERGGALGLNFEVERPFGRLGDGSLGQDLDSLFSLAHKSWFNADPLPVAHDEPAHAPSAAVQAGALPDLVIDDVELNGQRIARGEISSQVFHPGDTVTVEWDVDNTGDGSAASSRVTVDLFSDFDSDEVDSNATTSLSAGDSDNNETASFELPTTLAPQTYGIRITADGRFDVAEANEGNNEYVFLINVTENNELPDLVIDDVELNGQRIARGEISTQVFHPGDTITIEWDVDNTGDGSAGSSRATVNLFSDFDGEEVGSNPTNSLSAGSSDTNESVTFQLSSALPPQTYGIRITADGRFAISEANEANNDYVFLINVTAAEPPSPSGDDIREGTDTTYNLPLGEVRTGTIDAEPISGDSDQMDGAGGYVDKDWFRVTLEQGGIYSFGADSISLTTGSVAINLYDQNGNQIAGYLREGATPSFAFDTSAQASATQTYYLAVSAGGPNSAWPTATGDYSVVVSQTNGPPPEPEPGNDDYRDTADDTTAPLGRLDAGSSVTGTVDLADDNDSYGDKDVFEVHLTEGQVYQFRLVGSGSDPLPAGVFTIRDASFGQIEISGSGPDVSEIFRADRTGLHYVRVGSGGSPDDTGDYRLSLAAIDQSNTPDDYADTPSDAGNPGGLAPGGSALGTIEAPGDLDYFTVHLTAGKIYHFSVSGEEWSNTGAMDTVALSLRGPSDFDAWQRSNDGNDRASFGFHVRESGTYYLRVGAGDDSADTGGYRISVSAAQAPPPPPPPLPPPMPALTALQELDQFLATTLSPGFTAAIELFGSDEFWASLRIILKKVGHADSLGASNIIFKRVGHIGTVTDFTARWIAINNEAAKGGDFVEAAIIEMTDFVVGELIVRISEKALIPAAFALGGVVGGVVATFLALGGGTWAYSRWGSEWVKNYIDRHYDGIDDYPTKFLAYSRGSVEAGFSSENDSLELIKFDESYYRATYIEVDAAIAQGSVSSAYAHYLTIGIDLGYQPSMGASFTRDDLAVDITNNDPTAFGSSAVLKAGLGELAGDGVTAGEQMVATAVRTFEEGLEGSSLDARLSALAHRKALDLAVNLAPSLRIDAGDADFSRALRWSDGSDFAQLFAAELEAIVGPGAPEGAYRLFVVASPTGSPADVLARLQAQEGWGEGSYDTFGIAEFGGLWVVILADRADGVEVIAPGDDTLATASIYGSGEDEMLLAGLRAGRLFGLGGADELIGGGQADLLDGGDGADRMVGGIGNDTYVVDEAADVVSEGPNAGTDTVRSAISYSLVGRHIENLVLTGTASLNGWGNDLANQLTGNSGANALNGRGGADRMAGGGGNDRYIVDNAGDVVIEAAAQGFDTVFSSVAFSLAYQHIENLVLTGSAAIDGTGNSLDNDIHGNAAANRLQGLGGNDFIEGGAGNDFIDGGAGLNTAAYTSAPFGVIVDLSLSGAQYTGGGGTDTLRNIRNVTGSAHADVLRGNALGNVLDGGRGADRMSGGNGNDSYVVDNAGDRVFEASAAGGLDTVYSSIAFNLAGQQIENLVLTGAAAVSATGNSLANQLTGNGAANALYGLAGNDRLDGGAGADRMSGGDGNDVYFVDNAGDRAIEASAAGGFDTVYSSVSFSLAYQQLEKLVLTGAAAASGTGNSLDNEIVGNSSANALYGMGGNDRLDGGAGADRMSGGDGDDVYFVDNAGDRAIEANATGGTDSVYSAVDYNLAGQHIEQLTLTGAGAIGGTGNSLANRIVGNAAANSLSGLGGDDALNGGGGADRLYGGAGKDLLAGGAGKDVFHFDSALSATTNVDRILDFSVADDAIYLDRSVFKTLGAGTLSASAFVNGTAAGDANDRILYHSGTGRIWYDADGSGAGAAVLFATVTAGTALTNLDFYAYTSGG